MAVKAADQSLLEEGEDRAGKLDRLLHQIVRCSGEDDCPAFARDFKGGADDVACHFPDGDDRKVRTHSSGQIDYVAMSIAAVGIGAIRPELASEFELCWHRVDDRYCRSVGVDGSLYGVGADSA